MSYEEHSQAACTMKSEHVVYVRHPIVKQRIVFLKCSARQRKQLKQYGVFLRWFMMIS